MKIQLATYGIDDIKPFYQQKKNNQKGSNNENYNLNKFKIY